MRHSVPHIDFGTALASVYQALPADPASPRGGVLAFPAAWFTTAEIAGVPDFVERVLAVRGGADERKVTLAYGVCLDHRVTGGIYEQTIRVKNARGVEFPEGSLVITGAGTFRGEPTPIIGFLRPGEVRRRDCVTLRNRGGEFRSPRAQK